MKNFRDLIKKKYSSFRKSQSSPREGPKRLIIEKTKWLNNTDSPVMLMIDDLANAWHSKYGKEIWDKGGDWGGGLSHEKSAISFIRKNIIRDFPEIKITFFAVAGSISQYTYHEHFSFSEPLDDSNASKKFFKELAGDANMEIAYHGYNHGTPGETTENYTQEWKGFKSIDEACGQIEKGKAIFNNVFGQYPLGGKYGGWEYNDFADDSIDSSGFLWWCRDWMPRDVTGCIPDEYYEPQFFGKNMVVALPSTVHGFFWDKRQVNKLLEKNQIIAIEEHIAPVRPDGRIQTPNIIHDIEELKKLFIYLRKKNVWYATATEIANYFIAYSCSTIYDVEKDSFKIRYNGRIKQPVLTLIIDCQAMCVNSSNSIKRILLPDGSDYRKFSFLDNVQNLIMVNLPVQNGSYFIKK